MGRLQDKCIIVTGASRGIGRGIAEVVAEEGAHVAVNYVQSAEDAEETADAIRARGRRAVTVQADVSKRDQVEVMVGQVTTELGPIDVLVNNAGIESIIPFLDMTDQQWQQVMETKSVPVKRSFRRLLVPGVACILTT